MSEWRTIDGWENYEVSDDGRIRRAVPGPGTHAGRILVSVLKRGYPVVTLVRDGGKTKKNIPIHVAACRAFHGPKPTPKHEVAHGNGIRSDCRQDNLRWDTRKGNHADKVAHGTAQCGEKNPAAVLTAKQVAEIRATVGPVPSGRIPYGMLPALVKKYGVTKPTLRRLLKYETWKEPTNG